MAIEMDTEVSLKYFAGLSTAILSLSLVKSIAFSRTLNIKPSVPIKDGHKETRLEPLHKQYLVLFFFIKLADWLQGTNFYTLYTSYGVDPGLLFITGFVTCALCCPIVGYWVDKYGRKTGCLVYCGLEVIIQIMEHSHDLRVLLVGRVLGGVSTALLFSAFESWIVGAHRALKLPNGDSALESMFSMASTLNGIAAVVAGLVARVSFSWGGEIAPFQVSLVITLGCMAWIATKWKNNKGVSCSNDSEKLSISHHIGTILGNKQIVGVAAVQSLFEGSMYTFVFVWVSVILSLSESSDSRPPIELLFSVLMLALSMGGLIFDLLCLSRIFKNHQMSIGVGIFLTASLAMGSVVLLVGDQENKDEYLILSARFSKVTVVMVSFCVFEACVGMFDPWSASIRSMYVPERISATVLTVSRVPLNIFVSLGVHLSEKNNFFVVFSVCCAMNFACVLICIIMGTTNMFGPKSKVQ